MSEQDWAREPWGTDMDSCAIYDKNGKKIVHELGLATMPNLERGFRNQYRIVACVNACAGVPTEDLAFGILAMHNNKADEMILKFDKLLKQSTELLKRLDTKETPDADVAENPFANMTNDEAKQWIEHPLTQARIEQAIRFAEKFKEAHDE